MKEDQVQKNDKKIQLLKNSKGKGTSVKLSKEKKKKLHELQMERLR